MRIILYILLLLPFYSFSQDEATKIKEVIDSQVDSWNKGDIEGFMQGYWNNDSLRFIGKKGITYGWKPVFENYKKNYSTKQLMGSLKFDSLKITTLSKSAAFVTGSWQISYLEKEPLGGWFSLLFRNIEGKWLIVADHTS